MAGNTLTLNFAGDATKLQAAAAKSDAALAGVGNAARDAGGSMNQAARDSDRMAGRMGALGAATSGATDTVDSLAGATTALADAQDFQRAKAARLARAAADVAQAQQDANQAVRDSKQASIDAGQAAIDLEQAHLDEKTALKDYNKAVKEHGRNSDEAKQAKLDLKQAGQDVKQAEEDQKQALEDGKQAAIDSTTAQLDLNDAMHEANPSSLASFAEVINVVAPLLSGLVGVISLVTAAQWLWNSALLANPLTWIVIAIIAVIAVIVLIATKTTWFQDLWKVTWGAIKSAAKAVGDWFTNTLAPAFGRAWDWIKDKGIGLWNWIKAFPGKIKESFTSLVGIISTPFRVAFNLISDAWNNTVGRLNWTIPDYIPYIGGNTVRAPRLPKFHTGGVVPGSPGQEVPIMAMAGERVSRPGPDSGGQALVSVMIDGDVLIEALAKLNRRRGGDVGRILGGANA